MGKEDGAHLKMKCQDVNTFDLFCDCQSDEDVVAKIAPDIKKGATLNVEIAPVVAYAWQLLSKIREELAKEISVELDRSVTINILDVYASPLRENHEIMLQRFIALLDAIDCYGLLAFICKFVGYVAVLKRHARIVEIWFNDYEIAERQRKRDALMGKVWAFK